MLQKDLSLANRLISALPAQERGLFLEHSELVEVKHHAVLIKAGQVPDHAYFPVDSFVSVVLAVDDAPGGGARFTVKMPLAPAGVAPAPARGTRPA